MNNTTSTYKQVTIYTDGSCLNNPGIGGYCAILKYPNNKQKVVLGAESDTTNNRMELKAIIEGIKALPGGNYEIAIISDSLITVRGINEWLQSWMKQNFKKTKNSDLWKEYLEIAWLHRITAQWVKGHNGHPENELCDKLAREQALAFRDSK
jgi:ribonuclease HI